MLKILNICLVGIIFISGARAELKTVGERFSDLKRIKDNIVRLEKSHKDKGRDLSKTEDEILKKRLSNDLVKLEQNLSQSKNLFINYAANINFTQMDLEVNGSKRDLLKEAQDLLLPVFDGLRRISARPRRIEALRKKIEVLEERISLLKQGILNLEKWSLPKFKSIEEEVRYAKERLKLKYDDLSINLDDYQRRLSNELGKTTSVMDVTKDLVKKFFGRRGKNLLLAFLAFILMYWLLIKIKRSFLKRKSHKFTHYSHYYRSVKVFYNFLTFILSLMASLLSLYVLNDWVLVTFFTLFILSLFWSLKHLVPKFIKEGKIILNLGPVREGEKIIKDGIAWRVESLGFYSTLKNDYLDEGIIRVQVDELLDKYSKKYSDQTPWFPSRKGDWVLLRDKVYGEVHIQTPEQVVIKKWEGSYKYYQTSKYLQLGPENMSDGFQMSHYLHLDHAHQQEILTKIIPELYQGLKEGLALEFSGLSLEYDRLMVELSDVTHDSLVVWIKIFCDGKMAPVRPLIANRINGIVIDQCNKKSLIIPNRQLTVRMSNNS